MTRLATAFALGALAAAWISAWLGWFVAVGLERQALPGLWTCVLVAWAGTLVAWAMDRPAVSERAGRWWGLLAGLAVLGLLAWQGQVGGVALRPEAAAPSALVVLGLAVAVLWWSGAQAYLARQSAASARRAVGLALLALGLLAVVSRLSVPVPLGSAVVLAFVAGAGALALAQLAEATSGTESGTPDLGRHWLLLTLAAVAAAGGVALLVAGLLLPGALGAAAAALANLPDVVVRAVAGLVSALLAPVFGVLEALVRALFALWALLMGEAPPPEAPKERGPSLDELMKQPAETGPSPLATVIAFVVAALLAWLLVRWLARAFRRYNDRHGESPGATRESGFTWHRVRSGLTDLMTSAAAALAARRTTLEDLSPVRVLYRSLLAEGYQRGHPRAPAATPYEYRPEVDRALPGTAAEVEALTEAYVAARYGDREPDAETLAALEADWRRVQASGTRAP